MRYWSYFAAKIAVFGGFMYGLLWALNAFWPYPRILIYQGPRYLVYAPRFGNDLVYTLVIGLWFLLCCGGLYLCVLDQRHRCRVCLRRLRMPVETGSWSSMLQLGRPRIEYICPYGHGTLREAELQISGLENPEWTPQAGMWEDLCAAGRRSDQDQ